MSLLTRLTRLFAARREGVPASPQVTERLAVAALLVHVARVDGRVSEAERTRLTAILARRFGADLDEAGRLVEEAGELDHQSGDVDALVDLLGHGTDDAERRRILALAHEIAASDGILHEFEDGLLWRLGRALGLDEAALAQARDAASRAAP
ncbi:TerB family tellurite resistance protein [Salinarimonas soli]|uniref:TerB family tellurite resistance protein n=1 Tax=Salinarimonas soli TaxID=1638099 RepID=A0A5B2VEU4_9HYPH|nr:TerB family tellurite resistance protein [Salinarimonas soli]KAA2236902.1 TerB family tellurite resistance protein [Salinarimonas soli]